MQQSIAVRPVPNVAAAEDDLARRVAHLWIIINDFFQAENKRMLETENAEGSLNVTSEQFWFNHSFWNCGSTIAEAQCVSEWLTRLGLKV